MAHSPIDDHTGPAAIPDVSVVMATKDRVGLLQDALDSLARQEGCVVEVIVTDDGSVDRTAEVLSEAEHAGRLRLVSRTVSGGPAVARNEAWRRAQAGWVAFTDDDCVADPHWAASLLAAAQRSGADLVQGLTSPNPTHDGTPCWRRTVEVRTFNHKFQTCNLLVRREVLEALDGFDESYPFAGEDTDLGWRATALGYRATFAPEAVVLHAIRENSFRQHLRARSTWADLTRFFKRHPESRSTLLYGRWFYRRSHAVAAGGVIAAGSGAVLVSAWVPLVLFAAHAANSTRQLRRAGRPIHQAVYLATLTPVVTLWELVQFLRCSVRDRVVVI